MKTKHFFFLVLMLLTAQTTWVDAAPVRSVDSLFSVARSFRYVPDPPEYDQWQSADETAARKSGDCEDKALWLYRELKKNGYEDVHLVVGRFRPFDRTLHAWVFYTDDAGKNVILDPTTQRRPWHAEEFSKNYYLPLFSFNDLAAQHRTIAASA